VLAEVHARPFTPIESPRRILHFAFDTASEAAKADRAALAKLCAGRGLEPLKDGAKHHRVKLGGSVLRWEQHSEFTTYTWELPSEGDVPFHPVASSLAAPMSALPQPGPVLVALDLHLMRDTETNTTIGQLFDRASLAVAEISGGDALFATDFKADASGFVRVLLLVVDLAEQAVSGARKPNAMVFVVLCTRPVELRIGFAGHFPPSIDDVLAAHVSNLARSLTG
jgi:uncharacterized membrane-anchored protein